MNAQLISPAKKTAYSVVVFLVCFISQPGFTQEYSLKDSAFFQRSLSGSRSNADRIYYQLEMAEYFIRKPASDMHDLELAGMWINRARELNEKLRSREAEGHILLEESSLLEVKGPSSKSREMLAKAADLLKNSSGKCLRARAARGLSQYCDAEKPGEISLKTDLIKQALALFDQCGNKLEVALTQLDRAQLLLATGNASLALKTLEESQTVLTAVHYKSMQRFYCLLGTYYNVQADFEKCLKYEYKALDLCRQMKDSTALYCEVNNIIGLSLLNTKKFAQAVSYFRNVLALSKRNEDTASVFSVSMYISIAFSHYNKPVEALQVLDDVKHFYPTALQDINNKVIFEFSYLGILVQAKRYDQAGPHAKELMRLAGQPRVNWFNITNSYRVLFNYYFAIRDYDAASLCLTSYEKSFVTTPVPALRLNNLNSRYELDTARKDYKSAFFHLLKYKDLNDSIFTDKQSQQMQQLQVRYDTKKKEDEIRSLTQNARVDQVQLKSAQLTRNVTLGGILAVVLIAGTQYRRYSEKKKGNLLITEQNKALHKLVSEKEWLLKEIHHRVKNNLHTVICLLESQAAYLENDALKAIENSRHRIYAMSLIHQKLYRSDDIKVVDMSIYLAEFIQYLEESFGSPERVQVILEAEQVKLGAGQAIPVGLIVNETITNAFKYAFPEQKTGEIKVELKKTGEEIYLAISDNGIGFTHQPDQEINSLGLELIKGLTLDLRGTISFNTDKGTRIAIRFTIDPVGVPASEEDRLLLS